MIVGVVRLELFIRESDSLKDKRRILSSLIQRIRHRFNVSIAEVGGHDLWRRATLGVALVTNDRRYAEQVLSTIVEFVGRSADVELTDYSIELL
ncbi:MAG: DUF503 domain-containing protein [Bacillota bacterium]|nr:DUF503 domain-containing protein [Bacillota bacterium]REJ37448.1 MAG: DUF503 domain-containing protein [Bacillota bacterium]